MKDDDDDDAAPPPSGARSAVPGSPLRLYTAHFLLGDGSTEAAGAAAAAACCHQYLYEHPNGLFIVGIGG